MTVADLSAKMSEREFVRWAIYRRDYSFPWRRLELGLAMVSMWVARTMGGSTLGLQDFLFDGERPAGEPDTPTNVVKALGGGRVIQLGRRKD